MQKCEASLSSLVKICARTTITASGGGGMPRAAGDIIPTRTRDERGAERKLVPLAVGVKLAIDHGRSGAELDHDLLGVVLFYMRLRHS